jgi:hypothetical protein
MVFQSCGIHGLCGVHAHCTVHVPPAELRERATAEPDTIIDADRLVT